MTENNKKKAIVNIKKAIGILNTVVTMMEKEEYCIDVMQQSLAAVGLVKSANNIIFSCHLRTCFKDAMLSQDEKKQERMIEELITLRSKNE